MEHSELEAWATTAGISFAGDLTSQMMMVAFADVLLHMSAITAGQSGHHATAGEDVLSGPLVAALATMGPRRCCPTPQSVPTAKSRSCFQGLEDGFTISPEQLLHSRHQAQHITVEKVYKYPYLTFNNRHFN